MLLLLLLWTLSVDDGLDATVVFAADDEDDGATEEEAERVFDAIDFGCFFFKSAAEGAG